MDLEFKKCFFFFYHYYFLSVVPYQIQMFENLNFFPNPNFF